MTSWPTDRRKLQSRLNHQDMSSISASLIINEQSIESRIEECRHEELISGKIEDTENLNVSSSNIVHKLTKEVPYCCPSSGCLRARPIVNFSGQSFCCSLVSQKVRSLTRVCVDILLLILLLSTDQADGQRHKPQEAATNGRPNTQVAGMRPHRPLPADIIVMENGSKAQVSSLEDYLATQVDSPNAVAGPTDSNRMPSRPEIATGNEANTQGRAAALLHPEGEDGGLGTRRPIAEVAPATTTGSQLALIATTTTTTTTFKPKLEEANKPQAEKNQTTSSHHEGTAKNHTGSGGKKKKIPEYHEVRSLLNVKHDYPLALSPILCGYVWPLMAAITLFTNLMIVFVLTQRDMRTPTNVVLTAIAIADIIPIVVPVPWFVYLFTMGNENQILYPPMVCYFYQHSTRSVSEIFYFLSTWLNVLLAIQDYLTACRPNLAKKYCQIRVVVVEIVGLTLFAFLLNLPQLLKIIFRPVKFFYHGQLTWGCQAIQARWFKDLVGDHVALYDDVFAALIVVLVDGGPAVLLITLTYLLIRQLQRQRIQGHLLMEQARTASKRRRERHRQQEYESSARVMIFVLLAFLAVKIPFATIYSLMIVQSRFEIHFVENLVDFQKAISITDFVFVLSYPLNFTIFCCCSKKFRHKCAQLLGECNSKTKTTRNRLMHSFSVSLTSSMDSAAAGSKRPSEVVPSSDHLTSKQIAAAAAHINGLVQQQEDDLEEYRRQQEQLPVELSASSVHQEANRRFWRELRHDKRREDNEESCLELTSSNRDQHPDHDQHANYYCYYEDKQQQLRRQSNDDSIGGDSIGWPSIAPSPPALQIASFATEAAQFAAQRSANRHQLPQIVTTRCESIRESPTDDEGEEEEGDGGENSNELEQPEGELISTGEDPATGSGRRRSSSGSSAKLRGTRGQIPWRREPRAMGSPEEAGGGGKQAATLRRNRKSLRSKQRDFARDHEDHEEEEEDGGSSVGSDEEPQAEEGEDEWRLKRPARWFSARGSSDPGSGSSCLSIRRLGSFIGGRRASGGQAEGSAEVGASEEQPGGGEGSKSRRRRRRSSKSSRRHHPQLQQQMEHSDKQRSLSLSNSKLSTLPNATGQLADILMSTLLLGGSSADTQRQSPGGGGRKQREREASGSRGAVSEPPMHLATAAGESTRSSRRKERRRGTGGGGQRQQ